MSQIVAFYSELPSFSATDQREGAIRYAVAGGWADALGGEPTADEVVAFNNPPPSGPLSLQRVASVRLLVDGFDVTGLERSSGLSVAFVADTDVAWVFFDTPQADTDYIVMPEAGVTKYADYLEVTKPGLSEINLIVFRVQ